MSGKRLAKALARIEAAASRIELAAPRADASKANELLAHLSQKHDDLRGEATRALADIDRLIESLAE